MLTDEPGAADFLADMMMTHYDVDDNGKIDLEEWTTKLMHTFSYNSSGAREILRQYEAKLTGQTVE